MIRIVAGGGCRRSQSCMGKPVGNFRSQRDGLHEESCRVGGTRFHVGGPAHGTDAGGPILKWNEPQPAVFKPHNGDVAFIGATIAARIAKMTEDRRACVLLVLALDAKAIG